MPVDRQRQETPAAGAGQRRRSEPGASRSRPPDSLTECGRPDPHGPGLLFVVLASIKTNILTETVDRERLVRAQTVQRITPSKRREIVRLYLSGLSTRDVAGRAQVSKTAVLRALRQEGVAVRARGGARWRLPLHTPWSKLSLHIRVAGSLRSAGSR